MSTKSRGRTLALVLVLELAVGAFIWFSQTPADAQPAKAAVEGSSAAPAPAPEQAGPAGSASAAAAPAAPAAAPAAAKAPAGSPKTCPKSSSSSAKKKTLADDLVPIGILIVVITVVVIRAAARSTLGHSIAFRSRRLLNWLPLGLTYSFLYFGRYNLKQFQGVGLTEAEYGTVFGCRLDGLRPRVPAQRPAHRSLGRPRDDPDRRRRLRAPRTSSWATWR